MKQRKTRDRKTSHKIFTEIQPWNKIVAGKERKKNQKDIKKKI